MSPAGSNSRTACTKLDDSSWTTTTMGLLRWKIVTRKLGVAMQVMTTKLDSTQCQATIARHYSPAGTVIPERLAQNPVDSSWTTTTGLTSVARLCHASLDVAMRGFDDSR